MGINPVQQLQRSVVRSAACVLGGMKPAALFNFAPRRAEDATAAAPWRESELRRIVTDLAADFSQNYARADLRADVMFVTPCRSSLFVSRPSRLQTLLADPDACSFLSRAGYRTDGVEVLIASLRDRLAAFECSHASDGVCRQGCVACGFPHEVGLILGYPLEDVCGFIKNGGRGAVAVGAWKAYGNAAEAQRRWDELSQCRQSIIRNYANGTPFEALIA